MVREIPIQLLSDGTRYTSFYCMQADFSDVPDTGISSGSKLYVMDTANNPKLFDEDGKKWYDTTGTEYTGA